MKIPPKKPHFFKPIQPGFKNGLKIPIGFLKYLKGNDNVEHAILKRGGYKWSMKVNGHRFEAGWVEFVEQHGLKLGNILMFRHEGNMEFEFSIFDSSHCDREYVEYMEEVGDHTREEISKKFKFKEDATERPRQKIKSSRKTSSHIIKVANHHKSFGHSHVECTIREYNISRGYLHLPRQFAYANGLANKKCDLIIRDERQRSWNVKLSSSKTRSYISGCGRTKFFADNCLNKGDCIMFEVVTNGETPIWKFQVTYREVPLQMFQEHGLRVGDAYKFELIENGEMPIAQFHCKYSEKVAKREEQ
ncbi:B3 domain-containing protein REM9-like [Solanum lycopersicum]|uniref:B3 domain-containing protein REM9-like n=1 Tax=Solanum lycopersicum TaxID=4081 RepID=UPI000532EB65